MDDLIGRLAALSKTKGGSLTVAHTDQFSYHDPVDGSVSHNHGLRIWFKGGALDTATQTALADLSAGVADLTDLNTRTHAARLM
ncbi:hypothetical protein [Ruegeria hyattellae]|uniref:hypothetical protein n=1 Tax=Ruegeria hyattellae TaxID=3233337 RepID=UPI00355C2DC2